MIRCGDGLLDSFRLGIDKCSVDICVFAGVETTLVEDGGDGGGGRVGLVLGSGSSTLEDQSRETNEIL